jgi:ubiquinone/menaquinone biosynthesis C-methylase UbiE
MMKRRAHPPFESWREPQRASAQSAAARDREVATLFTEGAADWDAMYSRRDVLGAVHQRRLQRTVELVESLRLPTGSRALELGSGAGLLAVALARRGFQVEATDVVEAMRARTLERVRGAGLGARVTVSHADAHEIPFPDGTFELVVALGVLPWVHAPLQAASEVRRVLRPTGYAILTVGNRWRLTFLIDPLLNPGLAAARRNTKVLLARIGHPLPPQAEVPASLFGRSEFERLLAQAGLDIVSWQTIGFGPVTIWRREILPRRDGLRLDRFLQRRADLGMPLIGALGAQHLVVARPRPNQGAVA